MRAIKFRWVGKNKKFDEIKISKAYTTEDILNRNYDSFFMLDNRGSEGNCEFLSEDLSSEIEDSRKKEIFKGDIVEDIYGEKFEVKFIDGSFVLDPHYNHKEVYSFSDIGEVTIRGNIYSNVELLCRK